MMRGKALSAGGNGCARYISNLEYTDEDRFERDLEELAARLPGNGGGAMLFHVLNAANDTARAEEAARCLERRFPGVPYLGSSANANVIDGALARKDAPVTVICDLFEEPDAAVEVMQLPLDYECQGDTARTLIEALARRPWVKIVEILATIDDVDMPNFCADISRIPEHIVCFGGCALSPDTDYSHSAVFSSEGSPTTHGIVFVLYGGENLHATTQAIHGWKPLGMPFRITRASKSTLYELNGKPAYETYYHYLKIANDDDFSWNGLLFPLSIDHDGLQILRTPVSSNPDGSLTMTADIADENHECRIAYGDPTTILNSIGESAGALRAFQPQAILVFSCASRLMYWGDEFVSRETMPFQAIAPVAGFFTGGELMRHKGDLTHHNVTLVVAALREGDASPAGRPEAPSDEAEGRSGFNLQLAIINRMASFIGAASEELQEAYDRMEAIARTDGLTGLANRRETERIIIEALRMHADGTGAAPSLIMYDLDDFKHVNDTFGHEAGDEVLRGASALTRRIFAESGLDATAGRWGGEEFMIALPGSALEEARQLAERLRSEFAAIEFPRVGFCTMSLGVAQAYAGESFDRLCSRVDNALYKAKRAGKNRVEADA